MSEGEGAEVRVTVGIGRTAHGRAAYGRMAHGLRLGVFGTNVSFQG